MTMTASPDTRVTGMWLDNNREPIAVADRPSTMKTTENPATKRLPPRRTAAEPALRAAPAGCSARPRQRIGAGWWLGRGRSESGRWLPPTVRALW